MRSCTSSWFECSIKYEKTLETGVQKKVSESYIVDALSFTEAESRIIEEKTPFIVGEFEVSGLKKAKFTEVFFDDDENADKWYKVKLQFIDMDDTGNEKKSNALYLVQSSSLQDCVGSISDIMKGSMVDYVAAKVEETAIMDVYEHK